MLKWASILLLVSLLSAEAYSLLGFGPPKLLNHNGEEDNNIAASADAHPQVRAGEGGSWVCVWLGASPEAGGDPDAAYSSSRDNGVSWSRRNWLNLRAPIDREGDFSPCVVTDGSGNWVAAWESQDTLDGTLGSDVDLFSARSGDNGVNWSWPAPLNSYAGVDGRYDHDFVVRISTDGFERWAAIWTSDWQAGGMTGEDRDIFIAWSLDHGQTWSDAVLLDPRGDEDVGNDGTGDLCTDGAGVWIAVWYSNDEGSGQWGADWDILYSRSEDGGLTWSPSVPLNSHATSDTAEDRYPRIATDGDGTWIVVWDAEGLSGPDRDIYYSRSTDEGTTWSSASLLHADGTEDNLDDVEVTIATDGRDWLAAWRRYQPKDADIAISRSTDRGDVWAEPSFLNSSANSDSRSDMSPEIATDGNGCWLVVWSSFQEFWGTVGFDSDIFVARSENLDAVPHDTDADGIDDTLEEIRIPYKHFTHRYLPDSDGDGLWDGSEDANRNGVHSETGETHTRSRDTDGDLYEDGIEALLIGSYVLAATDPADPLVDADADALPASVQGSPLDPDDDTPDTDGDRYLDGYEATVMGLASVTAPLQYPLLGDVNENGPVDNGDAQLILYLFAYRYEDLTNFHPEHSDLDRNATIDNADAQQALNFFGAQIPHLPAGH